MSPGRDKDDYWYEGMIPPGNFVVEHVGSISGGLQLTLNFQADMSIFTDHTRTLLDPRYQYDSQPQTPPKQDLPKTPQQIPQSPKDVAMSSQEELVQQADRLGLISPQRKVNF